MLQQANTIFALSSQTNYAVNWKFYSTFLKQYVAWLAKDYNLEQESVSYI